MLRNLISDFLHDLRTQRTRALLTMFAVGWGTLSVVLLLAFGEGLKRVVVESELGAGDHIFMVYGGETTQPHEGLPTGRNIRLTDADLELLLGSIPEIDLGSVSYGRHGTVLRTEHLQTTTMMEGVDPAFEEMRSMYPTSGGRFLNPVDVEQRRRVAFLGDSIAARLFPGAEAVGQTLMLDGVPFTVVGTMVGKRQSSMNNGPDADRVIIPSTTMQAMYGYTRINHLLLRPRDMSQAERVKRRIYEVLGERHQFAADDERALGMWDMIEGIRTTRLITGGIQIFLGVVGGLTLLVAGIGVANVMYVVVRERTREIGVKRALGARRRHITAQFVFEALAIALVGGLTGFALAAALVLAVDSLPPANEAMDFLANPKLSWPIGLGTVALLALIGVVAGYFPARRAAAVEPVEALRYE